MGEGHIPRNNQPFPSEKNMFDKTINHFSQRYPCCIVWTPIPCLTWFFPFVGHMGIATSQGIIRDFAGPYHVSTDNMAFGKPTKYLQLDPNNAVGGVEGWDKAVSEASEVYKGRMHNLCCDNCHSHVALALNEMHYKNSSWNMVKLASLLFFYGKHTSYVGMLKTWLPFCVMLLCIVLLILFL